MLTTKDFTPRGINKQPRVPYGVWTCADGREVLFDRRYRPMWQRRPGCAPTPADPAEWVHDIVDQQWMWWGGTEPRDRCKNSVAMLTAWGLS